MSQDYTDDCFATGHVAQTDMQNIENNFAALKSSFSGSTTPSNPITGMNWYDTAKKLRKFRNAANNAWLGLIPGDANQKIWIYRNDAIEGMAIDASVVDRVLSLKGGSNAYNVAGGNQAGTWIQPKHTLVANEIPSHNHASAGGHSHTASNRIGGTGAAKSQIVGSSIYQSLQWIAGLISSVGNHTHSTFGGGASHNHGTTTYRPYAAVGTLQYPDV